MFFSCEQPDPALSPDPFKACVVPRPIGWISTVDAAGHRNLAPFSFFNAISELPPMVMFCANGEHKDGGEKDSVTEIYNLPCEEEIGRMVMGRVLGTHIADGAIVNGRVSAARLAPIARLGYREYAALGEIFKMTRPGTP